MRALLIVLFAVGCATPRESINTKAITDNDYEFSGIVGTRYVAGTLRFNDGNYFFTTNEGSCSGKLSPERQFTGPFVRFGCRGVLLRFRFDDGEIKPEGQAAFSQTVITGHYRECVLWGYDTDNKRYCRGYETKTIEKSETARGPISVRVAAK